MRLLTLTALGLASLSGYASPARADMVTYDLNKPHTQVAFLVDHLGLSKSSGKFLDYKGQIMLDDKNLAASSVNAVIETASLDMGDATWDEHLKAEKYFNVAKYPTMVFKSTNVKVTGEHTADVTGDLTLLGVTKPVVLKVTHNKTAKHPMNGKLATGFSAVANIKRSDFGMKEGIPMVGDDVQIMIEAEAYENDKTGEGLGNK